MIKLPNFGCFFSSLGPNHFMNFILFLHLFSILKPDHDFSLVFQIPCERVFGSANISLEGRRIEVSITKALKRCHWLKHKRRRSRPTWWLKWWKIRVVYVLSTWPKVDGMVKQQQQQQQQQVTVVLAGASSWSRGSSSIWVTDRHKF